MVSEASSYMIRSAQLSDIQEICLLEIRSAQYEYRLVPLDYTVEELIKLWTKRFQSGQYHIVVAIQGDLIVGFMAILAPLKKEGFIQAIYVDPHYFNQGIGSALLKVADRIFSLRQSPLVKLYVEPMNENGVRFYKKAGYIKTNQKFRHLNVFIKEFTSC